VSADDVFAAADAEEQALRPAPWLERRHGAPRKPDEVLKTRKGRPGTREERIALNLARIRETEKSIADAEPDADVHRLQQRLAAYKSARAVLLHGRR
jgi:hypothetical protein